MLLGVCFQGAEGSVRVQCPSLPFLLSGCVTLDEEATWRSWGQVSWFPEIVPVPALRLSVSSEMSRKELARICHVPWD